VGSGVLKVTATDKDATTEHKMVGYSIQVSHKQLFYIAKLPQNCITDECKSPTD